jgi:hypothetical protein
LSYIGINFIPIPEFNENIPNMNTDNMDIGLECGHRHIFGTKIIGDHV